MMMMRSTFLRGLCSFDQQHMDGKNCNDNDEVDFLERSLINNLGMLMDDGRSCNDNDKGKIIEKCQKFSEN